MESKTNFELISWDYGRVSELYEYHKNRVWFAHEDAAHQWSLKGYSRAWIISNGTFSPNAKVLEVGAGYSSLPAYLAKTYNVEMWVADDFGVETGKELWGSLGSPKALQEKYPRVRYVFEPLGNPQTSSLPEGYFDIIYTVSTLEHIPPRIVPRVFQHMAQLLVPGGLMLHSVDLGFPFAIGDRLLMKFSDKQSERLAMEGGLLKKVPFKPFRLILSSGLSIPSQLVYHWVRTVTATTQKPYLQTARGWAKFLKHSRVKGRFSNTGLWCMVLDPNVLSQSTQAIYENRHPRGEPKPYWRGGVLNFALSLDSAKQ